MGYTYEMLDRSLLVRDASGLGGSAIVGCDIVVGLGDFVWWFRGRKDEGWV